MSRVLMYYTQHSRCHHEDSTALGLPYLSRLAPHKEVAEELAGWASWVPGNKSKLAGSWVPGGIEDTLQSMGH